MYVDVVWHYICVCETVWVINLHSCSIPGYFRYISGLWRDVCVLSLYVYSRTMVIWRNICWGRVFVFFSRGPLSLCILGSEYVCVSDGKMGSVFI